jgi:hypothetical protein
MNGQPPQFPEVGSITTGLGKLTPQVWDSLVWTAEWLHQNAERLNALINESNGKKKTERKWFLAALQKAKRKTASTNPPRYLYSWKKINLVGSTDYDYEEDDNLTSTGDSDEWDFAALNVIEATNATVQQGLSSFDYTNTGTDETNFPSAFALQAIGGGWAADLDDEITLNLNCFVMMHVIRDTHLDARYVFSAANSYDGSCA